VPFSFTIENMEDRLIEFFKNHKLDPSETSRSFVFDCPSCGGKNKLYVDRENGLTVCFKRKSDKCPKPGSKPTYALSLLTGLPFQQVKKELYDFETQLTDEIRVSFDDEVAPKLENPLKPASLPADIALIDEDIAKEGLAYLEGRGLNLELIKQQCIMYSPSKRRVIFPVIMGNVLYGWQGRAIDKVDKNFRMENLAGDWKAKTLMFYNNIVGKDFAIVAEGPVSALKFAAVGNYVATMGKEISRAQLDLLRKSGIKKLYLALDPDAVDKLNKIREDMDNELKGKIECFIIKTPDHREDFGDSSFEECKEAFNKAEKLQGDEIFSYIELKLKGNM
jgi:5S rRNA maturation endonuclease (ribonuclease M5)